MRKNEQIKNKFEIKSWNFGADPVRNMFWNINRTPTTEGISYTFTKGTERLNPLYGEFIPYKLDRPWLRDDPAYLDDDIELQWFHRN